LGGVGVGTIFLLVRLGQVSDAVPVPVVFLFGLVEVGLLHLVAMLQLEVLLGLYFVLFVELLLLLLLQLIDPVEMFHQVALLAHILLPRQLAYLILNSNLLVKVARERRLQLFLSLLLLEVVFLELS